MAKDKFVYDPEADEEKSIKRKECKIDFLKRICNNDGDICSVEWTWGGRKDGHIMAEKQNGQVILYDPQTDEKYYNEKEISLFLMTAKI